MVRLHCLIPRDRVSKLIPDSEYGYIFFEGVKVTLRLDIGRPSTEKGVAVIVEVKIDDVVTENVPYWLRDKDLVEITAVTIKEGFSSLGRIHSLVPGVYELEEFRAYVEIWGSPDEPSAHVSVSGGVDPESALNFYLIVLSGRLTPRTVLGKSLAEMQAARMAELELRLAVANAEGGKSSNGDDMDEES
jgi:hypothetical protein